jgi:hypothetical protein
VQKRKERKEETEKIPKWRIPGVMKKHPKN